jgi:release factor glutamine methyltransferase
MVRRRGRGEPLQHILGSAEFHGREFLVTPDAFIPRPETETLVEVALNRLQGIQAPLVADIGTGCGCIALTIAAERTDARLIATDISAKALDLARRNAARLNLADRVEFRLGDLTAPLEGSRVHALVANLPYVSSRARDTLPPEVRDWEPEIALFAGEDGLSVIRGLVGEAPSVVLPGGFVAMEVGLGQAAQVVALWKTTARDWEVEVRSDLAGIERIVVALCPTAGRG